MAEISEITFCILPPNHSAELSLYSGHLKVVLSSSRVVSLHIVKENDLQWTIFNAVSLHWMLPTMKFKFIELIASILCSS